MKLRHLLAVMVCLLAMVGCTHTPRIETGGQPVATNVVSASILNTGINMDSAFIRYYGQPEGDEILDTYEYLKIIQRKNCKVSPKGLQRLEYVAKVHNPRKVEYQMFVERYYYDETGQQRVSHAFEVLYSGNLSRKDFRVSLPVAEGSEGSVQLFVRDADGMILYQSPKAGYEIGRIRGRSLNQGLYSK